MSDDTVAGGRLHGGSGTQVSDDPHAKGVIDARLGRPAGDVIEATIVLEAWAGRPARKAMAAARAFVGQEAPAPRPESSVDPAEDRDQQNVVAEGIALVLSILSVAAWAAPLSRQLGADVLAQALRIALPISVALQWGLRSRYLSRSGGLALLARDGLACCTVAIALVEVPLLVIPRWGPIAAMLVATWVGGTVMTRRGWGLLYALWLVAGTIVLDRHAAPYLVLGGLTAFTVVMAAVAVLTRRGGAEERAGSVPRALIAAVLGGCIGVMLVADPSLAWGVRGVHPAIALVPSVIGSLWGGYYLWNFYQAVARGLSGVPLSHASRAAFGDPAMSIFLGAVVRLVATTIVLSALIMLLGPWTGGADDVSVFVAFGCVALMSMLVGLVESLSFQRAALVAVTAALGAELAWSNVVHGGLSGGALAFGAAVGMLLTLPPLLALLARSGRVLATTLWIQ